MSSFLSQVTKIGHIHIITITENDENVLEARREIVKKSKNYSNLKETYSFKKSLER